MNRRYNHKKMFSRYAPLLLLLILALALAACGGDEATATPDEQAQAQATEAPDPTDAPTEAPTDAPQPTDTAEPTDTPTPLPTDTPEPTATPTMTPTPEPELLITVVDEESGEPVEGAEVFMIDTGAGVTVTLTTDSNGEVVFTDVEVGLNDYDIQVQAEGYQAGDAAGVEISGPVSVEVALTPGIFVEVLASSLNLRGGPGTVYPTAGVAEEGDLFLVVGQSSSGSWLQIELEDGELAWITADLAFVAISSSLDDVAVAEAPPTPEATAGGGDDGGGSGDDGGGTGDDDGGGGEIPVTFEPAAYYDMMLQSRWLMEQMGGLLDRLWDGQAESCGEFATYYFQLLFLDALATYDNVPGAWQGVYNEHHWANGHVLQSNEVIMSLCSGGGGVLNEFNYGVARSGINEGLNRLNPAINAAAALVP